MPCYAVAFVDDKESPVRKQVVKQWDDVVEMLASPETGAKDGPGWLPANIAPGRRTKDRVESVSLLVLDIDGNGEGDPAPSVAETMAEIGLWGVSCVLHTSYSHDSKRPKYRLIFPPSRALRPEEVRPLATHVAALLGLESAADTSTMEPARLFYLPRCPAERVECFEFQACDGLQLDVDTLLADATAIKRAQQVTPPARAPLTGGVIDAFNEAHDVVDIIENAGYKPMARERWLWPGSETGMPGVRILDGGRVFSSHRLDPLHGDHSHDAFGAWTILEHGGNMRAAVADAARALGLRQERRSAPARDSWEPGRFPEDDPGLGARSSQGPAFDLNDASGTPAWVRSMQAWQPRSIRIDGPRAEVKHAVQDLIRAGKVGALVAAGGTGKTTLLLVLGVCHATGRKFLGQSVVTGTFVLLSNDDPQEDLEAALQEVVKAMRLTPQELEQVAAKVRVHSLQGDSGLKAFTTNVGGAIVGTGLDELLLEAVHGITDLVGIALDTLRQFSGGSSNDEQVVKLTVAGATDFALRTGAYVILPHHTGKQNYRDGITDMYCGSGSAAIADNCRFVLLLQTTTWSDIDSKVRRTGQERGDPLVLSSTRGSLLMKAAEPIFFHRDKFFVGRVEGLIMTRDQREDDRDRAVLLAVRKGAQSKNSIFRAVSGNRKDLLLRVDDLTERGHLLHAGTKSGTETYTLSTSGGRLLDVAGALK